MSDIDFVRASCPLARALHHDIRSWCTTVIMKHTHASVFRAHDTQLQFHTSLSPARVHDECILIALPAARPNPTDTHSSAYFSQNTHPATLFCTLEDAQPARNRERHASPHTDAPISAPVHLAPALDHPAAVPHVVCGQRRYPALASARVRLCRSVALLRPFALALVLRHEPVGAGRGARAGPEPVSGAVGPGARGPAMGAPARARGTPIRRSGLEGLCAPRNTVFGLPNRACGKWAHLHRHRHGPRAGIRFQAEFEVRVWQRGVR